MNQKFLKTGLLILVTTSILVFSCKKDETVATNPQETIAPAKKTGIKKKEAIKFSYNKTVTGGKVEWSVNPANDVLIGKQGNDIYLKFRKAGSYRVYARSGNSKDSTDVQVNDSTATNPQDTTMPGGGAGTPIDSSANPCTSWASIYLAVGSNTSLSTGSYPDSSTGGTLKYIDVKPEAVLANGCQSFSSVVVYDSTPLYHTVVVKGLESNCPNTVCTQSITYLPTSYWFRNPAVGLHKFNFVKDGVLLLTKQITVN